MGRLFKKLFDLIKKILKWLGPLAIIIYIAIWTFAPALIPIIHGWLATAWTAISSFATTMWTTISGWIATAWQTIGSWAGAVWDAASSWLAEASFGEVLKLALGAAIILNPEGVADGIGEVVDAVGDVVKDVFGPYIPWVLGGLGLWFVLKSRKEEPQKVAVEVRQAPRVSYYGGEDGEARSTV